MLSKCSNPRCTAGFLYLHDGKLFRMGFDGRVNVVAKTAASVDTPSFQATKGRRIEYFWLCGTCAKSMTLTFHKSGGITTKPLGPMAKAQEAGS